MTDSALHALAASGLIPADVATRIHASLLAIHDELFELDEVASMDPAAIAGTFLVTLSAGFAWADERYLAAKYRHDVIAT